jgi:glycosyltransferase involved in cell wall biosynthesis
MAQKTIDIVIPVLNEEKYLTSCLDSVLQFERPAETSCTIYIVDGISTDKTKEIALAYAAKNPEIRFVENPQKIQSCALNLIIGIGTGEFILRLDAHAKYPVDYLARCVQTMEETGADNVGGIVITLKGDDSYPAALVQALTTHKFGVGDSSFRTEQAIQQESDTVPFGFFRRSIFERIGFFDQRLVRAQDYEMNRRILQSGGKIWLNSEICSEYYNQPTIGKFLHKQFYKEAPYNAYMWHLAPYSFALRHAVTGVFAAGVIMGGVLSPFFAWIAWPYLVIMSLYFLIGILSAIQQSIRFKQPTFIFVLPFCFFLYHFIHGLGVLIGIARLLTGTAPVQKIKEPWPGAGRYRSFPA